MTKTTKREMAEFSAASPLWPCRFAIRTKLARRVAESLAEMRQRRLLGRPEWQGCR